MTRLIALATAAALLTAAPAFAQSLVETAPGNQDTTTTTTTTTGTSANALDRNAGDANALAPTAPPAADNGATVDDGLTAEIGAPPPVYPLCRSDIQDRCRVPGQTGPTARTIPSGLRTPA